MLSEGRSVFPTQTSAIGLYVFHLSQNKDSTFANPLKVFEAFIREQFRDVPGEINVVLNRYQLNLMGDQRIIPKNRHAWHRAIFPRSRIQMSMILYRDEEELLLYPGVDPNNDSEWQDTWRDMNPRMQLSCSWMPTIWSVRGPTG
jgi:hypothetical protein